MIYINQHVPKCINTSYINMFITDSQFTIQVAPTWLGVHNTSANTRAAYVNSRKATTKLLHEDHFIPELSTVGVSSKHQLVNLYYCAFDPDGVLKRYKVYTGSAECPYVQFVVAARVICTEKFVVGGTNGWERDRSQVSDGKVERVTRA